MDAIQQEVSLDKPRSENFPRVVVRRQRARRKFNAVSIAIEIPLGAFSKVEGLGDLINQALAGNHLWQGDTAQTPRGHSHNTPVARRARPTIEKFVAERCVCGFDCVEKHRDLYAAYLEWAPSSGRLLESRKAFGAALHSLGFSEKKSDVMFYMGIRLRAPREVGGASALYGDRSSQPPISLPR